MCDKIIAYFYDLFFGIKFILKEKRKKNFTHSLLLRSVCFERKKKETIHQSNNENKLQFFKTNSYYIRPYVLLKTFNTFFEFK